MSSETEFKRPSWMKCPKCAHSIDIVEWARSDSGDVVGFSCPFCKFSGYRVVPDIVPMPER